jgi:uncharacterized membrane protein (UPF0127 family)
MKFSKRSIALLYGVLLVLAAPVLVLSSGEAQKVPVLFVDADGRELCRFEAELAVTQAEQSRGLMYRPYMPHKHGMLFINNRDAMQHYWMKNVYIPLDIIFISGNDDVVYIHENAHPHDEATISSRYPARYILEINAGEAKECKIKRGVNTRFGKSAIER